MNILYLAHRLPFPPNKGDKLRAFRHIQHLAQRHRVWCACFIDDPADSQHIDTLKGFCEDVQPVRLGRKEALIKGLLGLAGGSTVTEAYYRRAAMARTVEELTSRVRFDVVVAFSSSMASYALGAMAPRRVLDLCDCDSRKWSAYADVCRGPHRSLYRLEGSRLAKRERDWVSRFDATIVVAATEAQLLHPSVGTGKLHIVGNGVELPEPSAPASDGEPLRGPTVGFLGVMNYLPNVDAVCWFARQCWPAIHHANPAAEFRIAGRHPTWRVRRLSRLPGVTVVGEVGSAIDELRRVDVSVAPLRIACGVQNKVLEAFGCGKPVVVTPPVAAALGAADGRNCLVADTPDRISRAVIRLLDDPAERARIGGNARRLVSARYRWLDQLSRLELIVTGTTTRAAELHDMPGSTAGEEITSCVSSPLAS